MATITTLPGNALFLTPDHTFDITSVVAKRVGPYVNYYSFNTDGTMFVIHATGVPGPDGTPVATITGWDHYNGADILQTASTALPLQPFLDMLGSRNPSSTRAFNWLMGEGDSMTGSGAHDLFRGLGGDDSAQGGGGNDKLWGGNGNDALDGGAGRDVLRGDAGDDAIKGGAGADVLTGGTGIDHFVFHGPAEGIDRITDFHPGEDRIALDAAAFGLAAAPVDGVSFVAGNAAVAACPTLLYDAATGTLSFDADGTGTAAAAALATLDSAPTLSAADFVLI